MSSSEKLSISLPVKVAFKVGRKTFEKAEEAMEHFARPYRVLLEKYLRPQLADGLDHCGRSFFKDLWVRNQGPPGIKFHTHGMYHHFWRQPKGYTSRPFKAWSKQDVTVGHFRRSPVATMDMAMELFTDSKVAKFHETGGTFSGKSGKLAVPLAPDMVGSKFMYDKEGALKARYKRPRSLGLVPIKFTGTRGTQVYLCRTYKNRKVLPMYVLKDTVSLEKRLHFKDLYEEKQTRFHEILNESLKKGVKKWKEGER
jgi:hypothetical protein